MGSTRYSPGTIPNLVQQDPEAKQFKDSLSQPHFQVVKVHLYWRSGGEHICDSQYLDAHMCAGSDQQGIYKYLL